MYKYINLIIHLGNKLEIDKKKYLTRVTVFQCVDFRPNTQLKSRT